MYPILQPPPGLTARKAIHGLVIAPGNLFRYGIMSLAISMRKMIGKSQFECAKFIGIALGLLMDLERGTGNPTLNTLVKIGAPFGLSTVLRKRLL